MMQTSDQSFYPSYSAPQGTHLPVFWPSVFQLMKALVMQCLSLQYAFATIIYNLILFSLKMLFFYLSLFIFLKYKSHYFCS